MTLLYFFFLLGTKVDTLEVCSYGIFRENAKDMLAMARMDCEPG